MRASKSKYYEFQEFSLAYLTSTDSIVSSSRVLDFCLLCAMGRFCLLTTINSIEALLVFGMGSSQYHLMGHY